MKYLVLTICLLMVGCAAPHYKSLPQGVFVKDAELSEATDKAIKVINTLGDVFFLSAAFCEGSLCNDIINVAITSVECGESFKPQKIGHCVLDWDGNGYITNAKVLINCGEGYKNDKLAYIIAHELWHCLGFGHLVNTDCLSYGEILADKEIEEAICPEMVEEFQGLYD